MLLLALDTSTLVSSVALLDQAELKGELTVRARPNHADTLMRQIEALLDLCGLEPGALAAVAVGAGPGSFTGLRIGFATTKGLCYATGRPLVCVSSLDALADQLAQGRVGPLVASLDARKGEVFFADYLADGKGAVPQGPPRAVSPEALAAHLRARPGPIVAGGDGVLRYRSTLETALGGALCLIEQPATPRAASVGKLAAARLARGERDDLFSSAPTYVRPSDAETHAASAAAPPDGGRSVDTARDGL